MSSPTDAYITIVAELLGDPVPIQDLDDEEIQLNLGTLLEQGVNNVMVSSLSSLELALAVTPGANHVPRNGRFFDSVVLCSDSIGTMSPAEWVSEFQRQLNLPDIHTLYVTGSACANFALGLDVARGLIAAEAAKSVLVVMADKILSGSRFNALSKCAYSDGAVSALLSATASPGSFKVLGSATEALLPAENRSEFAAARSTLLAMNSAATRAVGDLDVDSFGRIIALNLGAITQRLLGMATGLPEGRLEPGRGAKIGHCFAADIGLNLDQLHGSGVLADRERILALASSRYSMSAIALEYQT